MRSFLLAVTLFAGVTGCSHGAGPTAAGSAVQATTAPVTEAMVAPPAELTLDKSRRAICPVQWTCEGGEWFPTFTACQASCGATCFRDFHCTPSCLCP